MHAALTTPGQQGADQPPFAPARSRGAPGTLPGVTIATCGGKHVTGEQVG